MRWIGLALGGVLAVALLGFVSVEWQLWNPSAAEVEARYADADSQFVEIDGVRIHYKDQGQGPAVLLWHGNWGDLSHYDGWIARHDDKYRFIRIDITGFGLTGDDPKVDYSVERRSALVEGLLEHLGVERYFIVGTSLAGPMAYRAAAEQPDRVIGLMLANAGGLPRDVAINQPLPNPIAQWWRVHVKPRSYWDEVAPALFSDPKVASPARLERFYMMNNRKGRGPLGPTALAQFDIGDAPAILAQVEVPVLILWGGKSFLPYSEADRYWDYLPNAPKRMIKEPDLGHMWMLDRPALASDAFHRFAQDVLSGRFEADAEKAPDPPDPADS